MGYSTNLHGFTKVEQIRQNVTLSDEFLYLLQRSNIEKGVESAASKVYFPLKKQFAFR